MASRVSTGGRPGARFAQFKLVLLGPSLRLLSQLRHDLCILTILSGESAVGKVMNDATSKFEDLCANFPISELSGAEIRQGQSASSLFGYKEMMLFRYQR